MKKMTEERRQKMEERRARRAAAKERTIARQKARTAKKYRSLRLEQGPGKLASE